MSLEVLLFILYYLYCRIAHEILGCSFNVQYRCSQIIRVIISEVTLTLLSLVKNFKCFPTILFKLHYNVYKRKFGAELSPWSYYIPVCVVVLWDHRHSEKEFIVTSLIVFGDSTEIWERILASKSLITYLCWLKFFFSDLLVILNCIVYDMIQIFFVCVGPRFLMSGLA